MLAWLTRIVLALRSVLEVRALREAEILALRQQLLVVAPQNLVCLLKTWSRRFDW